MENYICYPIESFKSIREPLIEEPGKDLCILNSHLLSKKFISDNNCSFKYIPINDSSDPRCAMFDLDDDEKNACENEITINSKDDESIIHDVFGRTPIEDSSDPRCSRTDLPDSMKRACQNPPRIKENCKLDPSEMSLEDKVACNIKDPQIIGENDIKPNSPLNPVAPVNPCTLPAKELTIEQQQNCLKKINKNYGSSNNLEKILSSYNLKLDLTTVSILIFVVFISGMLISFFFKSR
jgi:hypothetical protein